MDVTIIIISAFVCGVAGFIAGYVIVNNIVLKKKKAQVLKDAQIEGENIKKEKIFQAKEKFLQLKRVKRLLVRYTFSRN